MAETLAHDVLDLVLECFVAELPKTPAGKVNRKVLRDRELAIQKSEARN